MFYYQTYRFVVFTVLQAGAILFLGWSMVVMMPSFVEALCKGMYQWNRTHVAFCWFIQMAVFSVLVSLRAFMKKMTLEKIQNQPLWLLQICWVLFCISSGWVLWLAVQLLLVNTGSVHSLIIGQWGLLLAQVYYLTLITAPMGALTLYRLLFREGKTVVSEKPNRSPLIIYRNDATTDNQWSVVSMPMHTKKGEFPKWVLVWVWVLFWFVFALV